MASTVTEMLQASIDRITNAFNTPCARATVFGVHIGGHLFMEGLLFVVIPYPITQKSYKPPKRPLTKNLKYLLVDSERAKLVKKLSEANYQNRMYSCVCPPKEVKAVEFEICVDELGSDVEGHKEKKKKKA